MQTNIKSESLGSSSASSQTAIPSPPSAIAPLSHESHQSNHHQNPHIARSTSVPTAQHLLQPPHFPQVEPQIQTTVPQISHRQDLAHPVHPNKMENQSMQISGNYQSSLDPFDQQTYGNHYNSTGVIHPTINNQQNVDYNDPNYYNSFYANYDDQMRPYSASSNSCSSSNSDGDSQMALHHHSSLHNNNQDHSQQHHNRHTLHHHNNPVLVSTNTQNNGTHLDAANLSPEYVDCMDQRIQHAFEVNCFGGIGNVGIHHLDDLHTNYMPNNQGVNTSNGIILNGNASSGGSVLFNGNNLTGPQGISDQIQYTSVIVDSNNYHMSNDQYVH